MGRVWFDVQFSFLADITPCASESPTFLVAKLHSFPRHSLVVHKLAPNTHIATPGVHIPGNA